MPSPWQHFLIIILRQQWVIQMGLCDTIVGLAWCGRWFGLHVHFHVAMTSKRCTQEADSHISKPFGIVEVCEFWALVALSSYPIPGYWDTFQTFTIPGLSSRNIVSPAGCWPESTVLLFTHHMWDGVALRKAGPVLRERRFSRTSEVPWFWWSQTSITILFHMPTVV